MRIGIDLGGSHICVGLIDENKIVGEIKEHSFTSEDKNDIQNVIINIITESINQILQENELNYEDIELIGMACPGTISDGKIIKAGNLGLYNFDITSFIKDKINIPFFIKNDGKCAGLAEKRFGALQIYKDCIFINIGTGIGGCVFMDDKLLQPIKYSGFELGHIVINKDGPKCTCGKNGCFETYASVKVLRNRIRKTLNITTDMSGQMLREEIIPAHQKEVKQDIMEYIEYLKVGICNLIDIFEPQAICFGGSFSYWYNTDLYKKLIEQINMPNSTFNSQKPEFVIANFKNDAGIIGATLK